MTWILWPLQILWRLATVIIELTGRLFAILLGVMFIAVGVLLTLTIVGALVGIPLILLGFSLVLRGLF